MITSLLVYLKDKLIGEKINANVATGKKYSLSRHLIEQCA